MIVGLKHPEAEKRRFWTLKPLTKTRGRCGRMMTSQMAPGGARSSAGRQPRAAKL